MEEARDENTIIDTKKIVDLKILLDILSMKQLLIKNYPVLST